MNEIENLYTDRCKIPSNSSIDCSGDTISPQTISDIGLEMRKKSITAYKIKLYPRFCAQKLGHNLKNSVP